MQYKNKKYVKIGCIEHPETVIEYEFNHGQEALIISDVYYVSALKFSHNLISEKQRNSMINEIHQKINLSLDDVNASSDKIPFTRKMNLTHPLKWINIKFDV